MVETVNPYSLEGQQAFAADSPVAERAEFLKKTYLHLFGAIAVFVALEAALMQIDGIREIALRMTEGYMWLVVLGAFMAVSYGCERMAQSAVSLGAQYAALLVFVVAEAVIFIPLVYFAIAMEDTAGPIIVPAGIATVALFAALSMVVFITRKDFSFMRGALCMAGLIAIGVIVASIIFGFELGIIFTVLMIGFASLWVLYDTSNVLHHYRTTQHVAASLALFASIALLLWYILRLAMYLSNRD